jgi:hypothetical protein
VTVTRCPGWGLGASPLRLLHPALTSMPIESKERKKLEKRLRFMIMILL